MGESFNEWRRPKDNGLAVDGGTPKDGRILRSMRITSLDSYSFPHLFVRLFKENIWVIYIGYSQAGRARRVVSAVEIFTRMEATLIGGTAMTVFLIGGLMIGGLMIGNLNQTFNLWNISQLIIHPKILVKCARNAMIPAGVATMALELRETASTDLVLVTGLTGQGEGRPKRF